MRLKANLNADVALLATTVIWGSTFVVAKDILERWPPIAYLTFRFLLAAVVLIVLFPKLLAAARSKQWRAGVTLGLLIGTGFTLQAAGQIYTTPSKSAFITGLTTPLVPFVAFVLLRVRPNIENLLGVLLASVGGALMLAPQGEGNGLLEGDLLTLASTGLFATHVVLTSYYGRRFDPRQLTVLQIGTAAALFISAWSGIHLCASLVDEGSLPQAVVRETVPLVWSARVVWQLVYLALVATVVTFLVWTWGQARMSATHAAIIFSLEPVFATLFAVAVRGWNEWIGARGALGGLLIFAGLIVSELRWSGRARAEKRAAKEDEDYGDEEVFEGTN
ncbi:MAG: DMT family transporter [Pyrinomonadaceae bacterium]|nr:DMT family transporter [Pyrinomonadaceae bacterium]